MIAKTVFVFIGPPGSGKGSLAHLCVQKLGWVQLSTGNLCRKHIAEQTPLGKEIDFAIKSGNLVSDYLITSMVEEWLDESAQSMKSVILDGYPRTAPQAQALNEILQKKFSSLSLKVVRFCISDDYLIERLSSRIVCQNKECQAVYSSASGSSLKPKFDMICDLCFGPLGRRKDDEIETVKERLAIYRNHENDLLDYYKNSGQEIIQLSVGKSLDDVYQDFKNMVGIQ